MNKTELINSMSVMSGLSNRDCEAALRAFTASVQLALKSGEKVQLVGFGSFESKTRAARTGRNSSTGEAIAIPASKSLTFRASGALKSSLQ